MIALLGGQDFPQVNAGNNINLFAKQATDFLKEVGRDNSAIQSMQQESIRLANAYVDKSQAVQDLKAQHGWDDEKLKEEAPAELGQLEVAGKNLTTSTALMADASARYIKSLDQKAQEYMTAWDKTEKKENKKNDLALFNSLLDIATGLGIGGNAIVQLKTKESKNVVKTLADATNIYGLRTGQMTDMIQAFYNGGASLSHLVAKTVPGALDEISGIEKTAGSKLSDLVQKIKTWKAKQEDSMYEGLGGW